MQDLWNGDYYRKYGTSQLQNASDILENYPLNGYEKILDIGCGPGSITKILANRVPHGHVIGIDPSKEMLSCALNTYKGSRNLQFFEKGAENFEFKMKFDLVTSFNALHFVSDHKKLLEKISLSLNPKGRILFAMIAKKNPLFNEVLNREPWKSEVSIEKRAFLVTRSEYSSWLKETGFTEDRIELFPRLHSFSTPDKMVNHLMTFLPYLSGLPSEKALLLAKDIVENFCEKQNRRFDLDITNWMLIVEAHLEQGLLIKKPCI